MSDPIIDLTDELTTRTGLSPDAARRIILQAHQAGQVHGTEIASGTAVAQLRAYEHHIERLKSKLGELGLSEREINAI